MTPVSRVQVGDDEPPDVVQERGDRQLVTVLPADGTADLVGRLLGGEGVDAEALGAHLTAAIGLKEVIDRSGARDCQHARGLEDLNRRRNTGYAACGDA